MIPQIDIENLIVLKTQETAQLESHTEALADLLRAECKDVSIREPGAIRFHSQWEPPMKLLKSWTKEHPELMIELLAESFADHHWLLKAQIQTGKAEELTVSRIDDEFDSIFKEIFGCSLDEWEQKPTAPFT